MRLAFRFIKQTSHQISTKKNCATKQINQNFKQNKKHNKNLNNKTLPRNLQNLLDIK